MLSLNELIWLRSGFWFERGPLLLTDKLCKKEGKKRKKAGEQGCLHQTDGSMSTALTQPNQCRWELAGCHVQTNEGLLSVWTTCNTHRRALSGSGFEQIYRRATITTFNNHTTQCYNNAHRLMKEDAEFLENFSWVWVDVLSALRWTNCLSRLSCSPGKRLQRPRTLI